MTSSHGQFITYEGIEGVGKSTWLKWLAEYLPTRGINVHVTREPGGTPLAEALRHLILNYAEEKITPDSELLMIFAARAQHLNQFILPALQRGEWVLCDRFTDATYAYQGGGRRMDLKKIVQLAEWVQGALKPNKTILLDAPVEVGLARAHHRSEPDRIEQENIEFFTRVRNTYLELAYQDPARFIIIDAHTSREKVQTQLKIKIDHYLQNLC